METILQQHLLTLTKDTIRLCIWFVLLMIVFVPLERVLALHPQKIFRKAFAIDLGYFFLNGLLPSLLLAAPLALLAAGLRHIVPSSIHTWAASLSFWTRMLVSLVAGEFGYYWGHRWMHEFPWLWRFHAVHHSAEEMDWLVSSRAHPVDIIFGRLCALVPMYALGLAQPIRGTTLDIVPLIIMTIGPMWGFLIHANLRFRWEWLALLLATPAFHHWHHTNDEHLDKNYASMLPIMDKLFGTWYLPRGQWPGAYGIHAATPERSNPQLTQPLPDVAEEHTPLAPAVSLYNE